MNKSEKGMICGLFLSKFNESGYQNLGFSNWTEFYNTVGFAIDVKPISIRNYRDEFDPYFDNKRQGYKREIIKSRKSILEKYKDLEFDLFCNIVTSIIEDNDYDIMILNKTNNDQFAKRLITGKAAEEYFRKNYHNIDIFNNSELFDMTQKGCGFDFKIKTKDNLYAVEIKGLSDNKGQILLTEKEEMVAKELKDKYFIFLVKNFIDKPNYKLFQNPMFNNDISFVKKEHIITQVNYYANIS
jgi:hypothetical protein